MRAFALVVLSGALVSCRASQPMTPLRSSEEITSDYVARAEQVKRKALSDTYLPVCEVPPKPAKGCGLLTTQITDERIANFIRNVCHEDLASPASDDCVRAFRRTLLAQVEERYALANQNDVQRACDSAPQKCERLEGIELLYLISHNSVVIETAKKQIAAIADEHDREQKITERARQTREQQAENDRRAMAAIGAAFSGFAEGMRRTPTTPATTSPGSTSHAATTPAHGCSSDFQCQYGSHCIKQQFQSEGTCARVVDEHGTPTYAAPRGGSIGIGGEGDCSFDTDCAIGFKCIKGSALKGHCMK